MLSSGAILTKKKSDIVKVIVTDRGGGCARALTLMEEAMVLLADACKGHLADLLIEDWAKPFKVHLKSVHGLILFIINHGEVYSIFISMKDVLALLIPAETRFATEIICARSLQKDKVQVRQIFTDERYELWHNKQSPDMRQKSREMKELALSDSFWHVNEVFVAVEETAETSLRILDSDKPNLKDAAFAFMRIVDEVKEPLLGRLATIEDWGDINLRLDLESEYLGKLPAYLMSMLQKRKADWLSIPVLAAACVNPVYLYSALESSQWPFAKTKPCERAVAAVIKKLLWGDEDSEKLALDGLDRYINGEGIYSEEGELTALQRRVEDPLSFWRHVSRSGLDCDAVFADEIGVPLVCAFANQSASERLNKYMVDSAGDKKRSGADLGKARKVLDLKVHLSYQKARAKAEAAERRLGERSVAADLRRVYEQTRGRVREENKVKERLRELRQELLDQDEHEQSALVNEAAAGELLGEARVEAEATLVVPEGYKVSGEPPWQEALTFVSRTQGGPSAASTGLVDRRMCMKWEGSGWCTGTIISVNDHGARKINGSTVNFFVKYDADPAGDPPVPHVLDLSRYFTTDDAEYDSWLLLEKVDGAL